jgi:glycosyltransferase involved in cell wall biosynthesis
MKINIITRCSRVHYLSQIKKSIDFQHLQIKVEWHIIFDTSVLKDISLSLIQELKNNQTKFYFLEGKPGDLLYPQSMEVINQIDSGFIYYLDDDNILHPNFLNTLSTFTDKDKIYVVNQFINCKDFTGVEYRIAEPKNMKVQGVDIAQVIFPRHVFHSYEFKGNYCADGILIEQIHNEHPEYFKYISETLSYYNLLVEDRKPLLPKVLYISDTPKEFETTEISQGIETRLETKHITSDKNITEEIYNFNPDVIAVNTDDDTKFPNLSSQPKEIRDKWVSSDNKMDGNDLHYTLMTNKLNRDNSYLISWFTPIYNTGEVLKRTYESLKNQTVNDWEWVITDDSSDGGKTWKIAEEIAKNDLRVKLYDINPRTKGVVGESKYRAASLCKGYILAELDHDDYLTPDATELLIKASKAFPDAGFFWTDSAEVNDNWEPMLYKEPFCYGYGTYREDIEMGKPFKTVNGININPKTIRHIVGVPNHIRAWRREVYQQIGGHNRNLSVADDYELIVRTFLVTRMVRIPKLGYIQFIAYEGDHINTQNTSRAEIQRLSNSIMYYYNEDIKNRFEELGYFDWGYYFDPNYSESTPSRFGDEECAVNYTYDLNK